jgi:hypothetical protein
MLEAVAQFEVKAQNAHRSLGETEIAKLEYDCRRQ